MKQHWPILMTAFIIWATVIGTQSVPDPAFGMNHLLAVLVAAACAFVIWQQPPTYVLLEPNL